jgi:HD-GYP domain-containing protein (c-di-GMP phosphodiesterase class II)
VTQKDFSDFIASELAALEAYDGQRPPGHPYEFHKHTKRVAADMKALSLAMGQPQTHAQLLHDVTLVHDAGKRLLPVEIWDVEGKPSESVKNQRRQHTVLGVKILDDYFGADNHDPVLDLTRDLMRHHHETMDGSGWLGIKGSDLSLEAQMLCVCDAFDGYSTWRPHFGKRDISPKGVLHRMAVEKTGQFDAEILAIFTSFKAGTV